MKIIGEMIVLLLSVIALAYGIRHLMLRKKVIYFQLIVGAVTCHILGFLFDVCEILTTGNLSEGFTTGYLGPFGCFLFLLTASYGYMDGIIDDGTEKMRKRKIIALGAPALCLFMLMVNMFAEVPWQTKVSYAFVWIPATFSSYFNLKHVLAPDHGYGFIKAIRPFNIAALIFTTTALAHLTVWNFFEWIAMVISGVVLGSSCIVMTVMAKRGVDGWTV